MKTLAATLIVAGLFLIVVLVTSLHQAAEPSPQRVVNGQLQACPQAPEPLCANGTDCCG